MKTKIPADTWNALGRLRQAIIDNTRSDDLFWIGEILLSELEKETGFNGLTLAPTGSASAATVDGDGNAPEQHGQNCGCVACRSARVRERVHSLYAAKLVAARPAPTVQPATVDLSNVSRYDDGCLKPRSMSVTICPACDAIHLNMFGEDAKMFASGSLSLDTALRAAADIIGARDVVLARRNQKGPTRQ
jgi:hypothetical protein